MKRIFFLILFFTFLGLPSFVLADTIVSSSISTNTTWSPAGGVYVINSGFNIASGTTLTIEPGTIIKAQVTGLGGPSIYGRLIAHGTNETPIYFTSIWNDNLDGDTDGYGPSIGTPGEWQGLYFKPGSEGSFDHVDFSYAGYGGDGYGNFVAIENDGGSVSIKDSNFHDNYRFVNVGGFGPIKSGFGIYNKNGGVLFVIDSIIDNSLYGIYDDSGIVEVVNSVIKNNIDNTGYSAGYGISAMGLGSLTLLNNTFSGNKRTAYVDASKTFIHSGNTSEDLSRRGFEMNGNIVNGLVLHSRDLPFIIGSVTVETGKTLIIEPGTVIKMNDYYSSGNIVVHGNLIARGTKENKIYITSARDDSVGGDTNGDSDATFPGPKNWNAIFLENGSKADFDNVVLRYSGHNYSGEYLPGVAAAIYQRGAEFSASNSLFSDNYGTVIFQDAGTTTINRSELANQGIGIWSRGGSITISQSSIHNHASYGVYNQSGLDLGWWWQTKPLQIIDARNNWWGSTDGPHDFSTSTPTGSGDGVSENVLYDPWLTEPPNDEPQTIDPVIIIPGIMGSAYKNGELVIDPILHTYDDLIATLIANGYRENVDLFTFPYEWRNSNVITALQLRDKINEIKNICSCLKVDLVVHSMGGLVARQLIQSDKYNNDVDQLIFLGTPHKGSPTSYLRWEAGEFESGTFNSLTKFYFKMESLRRGYFGVFDYIKNRPISSVQELLPIFDYLKDKETGIIREYPDNYPRNTFLENLNSNIINLLNSGVKITNFVGNSGNNTIEKIRVVLSSNPGLWTHGEPDGFYEDEEDFGLEKGLGDETVTILGATLDNSINNEMSLTTHQRIPTIEGNRIFSLLTGKTSTTNIDSGFNLPNIKVLIFQLFSPIDVVVTAPDGKKMGKNFETGGEYNEIVDAFYSGYQTEEEYVTVLNPIDGKYKIEVQGTGSGGEYRVLTSYISDKFTITTETSGITEPNQVTNLSVNIDNTNPENLKTEREITPEVLANDINRAYDMGWIKDEKTRDLLIKQIKQIIKFEEKENGKHKKKVDKILLKLLEKELEKLLKKDKTNQEVYNLLKQDINWLILNN